MHSTTEAFWVFFLKTWLYFLSVLFFFTTWPYHSSQSSAAWKAAVHVHSQPVNWKRCFLRPSCVNTMSEKLKKKSLQPMLMSSSGEFCPLSAYSPLGTLPEHFYQAMKILHQSSIFQFFYHFLLRNRRIALLIQKYAVDFCLHFLAPLNHLAYMYSHYAVGGRKCSMCTE